MPFTHTSTDHNPLLNETEIFVKDIDLLAQHIGHLILGKHRHVAEILAAKHNTPTPSTGVMIDRALKQLTVNSADQRHRRDGWLFQYMTWITMRMNMVGSTLCPLLFGKSGKITPNLPIIFIDIYLIFI
ncbi:hypothetical protein EZ456_00995 [Pedobacter psychrodurus]|uniref:Uncharacterized protein n=1 Tax=Pedobacter psychrodurus TaxID=2530456 RepID=A0A4V2MRH1_9SPHI|nr:hypothetical protein [Pedobacter psychrodurus]TCD29624.1 hypothetical protein EZ456_00995 [Pedobacter psychrodurus]